MWYRFARLMALASMAMVGAMAHHYWSAQAAEKRVVRVAAAADLKFALDEIREAFQRQHPGIEVVITYGSSGKFYSQLANRAPFDMFLSADLAYARRLFQQILALADCAFPFWLGSHALVAAT